MGDKPRYMDLAKNLSHLTPYPCLVQIKYDGVPITFIREGGVIKCYTRQNEEVVSVRHIAEWLEDILKNDGDCVIAECLLPGKPFKLSSGAVRKGVLNRDLLGIVFDGCIGSRTDEYDVRLSAIRSAFLAKSLLSHTRASVFVIANLGTAKSADDFETLADSIRPKLSFDLEGLMGHSVSKPFTVGKRNHGMARYKPQPTIDLLVDSFMEAFSEAGEPLGMLGRVNVTLGRVDGSSSVVGVGPGRLSHAERRAVWRAYLANYGHVPGEYRMVEVKYKPDTSYDALREPTLQRFSTDKEEPDVYGE